MSNQNLSKLIAQIERDIQGIDQLLIGLSEEDQRRIIQEKREKLMSIARIMISSGLVVTATSGILSVLFGPFGMLVGMLGGAATVAGGGVTYALMKLLGFDPFEWLHFKEYDHNPKFANLASSNPSVYNAVEEAGKIFMERNSNYLKSNIKHFKMEITSTSDVNKMSDAIISFCKCLPAAYSGNVFLLNVNDVRIILATALETILNKAEADQEDHVVISRPILKTGHIIWVRYEFTSDYSIKASCCSKKKYCSMTVKMHYFFFPSEIDFREALYQVETGKKFETGKQKN